MTDLMSKNSSENGRSIPTFAEKAINFIDKQGPIFQVEMSGLDAEGIFRLSGSAKDIEKMRDQLDRGERKFREIFEKILRKFREISEKTDGKDAM